MSYQRFMARVSRARIPFAALVELTYRCNLDCFFCYNDRAIAGEPLSTDQYLALLHDLKDLGTLHLTLSGGEPLAHKDFFLLGRKARDLGFAVRIKSNGHAVTEKIARRIKDEIDPFGLELSLHGADAATHDRQTRVAGSFEQLLGNVTAMRRMGLRLQFNSTLTAWNEHQLEAMFGLADDLGVRISFDPQVTPRDDGDTTPLSIMPSGESVKRLYRIQDERRRRALAARDDGTEPPPSTAAATPEEDAAPKTYCGTGTNGIAVDPVGNVYPCVQWRRAAGNLHVQSLKEIWNGSSTLVDIRSLSAKARQFIDSQEPEADRVGFCPALAEQMTGTPLKLYQGVVVRMDLRRQMSAEKSGSDT